MWIFLRESWAILVEYSELDKLQWYLAMNMESF